MTPNTGCRVCWTESTSTCGLASPRTAPPWTQSSLSSPSAERVPSRNCRRQYKQATHLAVLVEDDAALHLADLEGHRDVDDRHVPHLPGGGLAHAFVATDASDDHGPCSR